MFTEDERRTLLDLIDEENARDARTHKLGRTTAEVFAAQTKKYWSIRNKLITASLAEDSPTGV